MRFRPRWVPVFCLYLFMSCLPPVFPAPFERLMYYEELILLSTVHAQITCGYTTVLDMVRQVGDHGGDEQLRAGRAEEHEPARRHRGPSHLDGEGKGRNMRKGD